MSLPRPGGNQQGESKSSVYGGGSTAAAPIARDIMLQALFEGTPPLDAYPTSAQGAAAEMQRRIRDFVVPGKTTEDRA